MSVRSVLRGAAEQVLVRLPRTTKPGDRLILAYHNVVPNDWAPRGDVSLHMPLHKFEAQLRMIRNEAEIVSLLELLTTDAPNDRRVAITFDDAYASAMDLGVGACVAAGAACTVFVASGLLGMVPVWDRRAMEGEWSEEHREEFLWKQHGRGAHREPSPAGGDVAEPALVVATEPKLLRLLKTHGALLTLGNHSMTHANLGALTALQVQQEISDCDRWLSTLAGEQYVPVVAYPYGIAPKQPAAVTQDPSPMRYALLATGGWYANPVTEQYAMTPRWNVPSGVSAQGFSMQLRGRRVNG